MGRPPWVSPIQTTPMWLLPKGNPFEMVYPDQEGIGTLLIPNTVALVKNGPTPETGGYDRLPTFRGDGEPPCLRRSGADASPKRVHKPPTVPDIASFRFMNVNYGDVADRLDQARVSVKSSYPLKAVPGCEASRVRTARINRVEWRSVSLCRSVAFPHPDLLGRRPCDTAGLMTGRVWGLLANSLVLSLGTAFLSVLIGVPLAFLFRSTDFPLSGLLEKVFLIPLVVPPYLHALLWERACPFRFPPREKDLFPCPVLYRESSCSPWPSFPSSCLSLRRGCAP